MLNLFSFEDMVLIRAPITEGHNLYNSRRRNILYGISGNGHKECFEDMVAAIEDINEWRNIREWNDNRKKSWIDNIIKLLRLLSGNNILGLLDDILDYKYKDDKILNVLPSLQKYHNVCNDYQ